MAGAAFASPTLLHRPRTSMIVSSPQQQLRPHPLTTSPAGSTSATRPTRASCSLSMLSEEGGGASLVDLALDFPWFFVPGLTAVFFLLARGRSIGRFFEDILDFLDQKGGYVITEEQLKGKSTSEDAQVNFKSIEESFNKPKPLQQDENVNVFLL